MVALSTMQWSVGNAETFPPTSVLFSFTRRLNFQRPKRLVSVGALDEIKADLEGLAQRFLLLGFDPLKVSFDVVFLERLRAMRGYRGVHNNQDELPFHQRGSLRRSVGR